MPVAEGTLKILRYLLSSEGVITGNKVNDLLKMPAPVHVSSLKSFIGSVQLYAMFLPPNLATIAEPIYRLTKTKMPWNWSSKQEKAFYYQSTGTTAIRKYPGSVQ